MAIFTKKTTARVGTWEGSNHRVTQTAIQVGGRWTIARKVVDHQDWVFDLRVQKPPRQCTTLHVLGMTLYRKERFQITKTQTARARLITTIGLLGLHVYSNVVVR